MPKQSINTLKNWFKRGLKPLESQFADWLDSFVHKDDAIEISQVQGLSNTLNGLSTQAQTEFAGLNQIAFNAALKFDKNYATTINPQAGPIAFTLDATGAQPGRVHKVYIKSNGIHKPTVNASFELQTDLYLNQINKWNYLHFVFNASGKVDYWWTYQQ